MHIGNVLYLSLMHFQSEHTYVIKTQINKENIINTLQIPYTPF